MKQRVTISDVAKAAGVSKQTVSRAINDKGEINPETKARILEIIEELDYRPSRLAQGMITQRTYTVGVVVGNIANPFFPDIIRGVQDLAQAYDYSVCLCNSDDNPQTEIRMLRMLAAQGVDGIIVYASESNEGELRSFVDSYQPLVLINRHFEHPNVSLINIDTYQGAQLVANYLINQGHQYFGLLMPAVNSLLQIRRAQGFKDQMSARGQILDDKRIFTAKADLDGGYATTHRLLTQFPNTTAIFTYNDLMALGAIRACTDHKLTIPKDIAVVGFDDIRFAAMATPSLTTVHVDKYEIGQTAMRRLLAMINEEADYYSPIHLDVQLVLRESA